MDNRKIYIFYGRIEEWIRELPKEEKNRQGICARALLIQGLSQLGFSRLFPEGTGGEELEAMLGKGAFGKPFFKEWPGLCFNLSHSGAYAACVLADTPCGLDIQERRRIRTRRLLERTMTEEEQKRILEAPDPEWEFCRLWAYKESCLKLTGEGLSRSMQKLPLPAWYEEFQIGEEIRGCVSSHRPYEAVYQELFVEQSQREARDFLKSYS